MTGIVSAEFGDMGLIYTDLEPCLIDLTRSL
jgi:hypothetical protein